MLLMGDANLTDIYLGARRYYQAKCKKDEDGHGEGSWKGEKTVEFEDDGCGDDNHDTGNGWG